MKRIVLLIVGAVAPLLMYAGTGINLSDALARGTVKMDAVTTSGTYMGKALKLTLTNTGGTAIVVKVNTGVILKPANPVCTQLVLPGGESVSLKPHETADVEVEAFSNNAVMACPAAGQHYAYYRICGEELMAALEYVHVHALYDHLGQAAVWSISNYLAFNCVYDRSRVAESEKLIAHLVAVTHREKPTYYTPYVDNEVPGQRAYIGKADKVYVPFEVNLSAPGTVIFAVYNAKGELVKSIAEPQAAEPGRRAMTAELNPADYETGKYSVRLMAGERTLHERTVLVEPWITFKG